MKGFLLATLLAFGSTTPLRAQWIPTNGPYTGAVMALTVKGSDLFAGVSGGGVALLPESGTTWSQLNTGLTDTKVWTLTRRGPDIFVGTLGGGVFRSTNDGTSWAQTSVGLTGWALYIESLAVIDTALFAGTMNGLFRTRDNGASWAAADSGLPEKNIHSLATIGTSLFASTAYHGVFRSSNNGETWIAVNEGLSSLSNLSLSVGGAVLFAGGNSGVTDRSPDSGATWTRISQGLTDFVGDVVSQGGHFFATVFNGGVFRSVDKGSSWTPINEGLQALDVQCLAVTQTDLFVGTYGHGVYRRLLSEVTALAGPAPKVPQRVSLEQNYPNPFNPFTTIRYGVPHRSHVFLAVFNTLGQKAAELVNGDINAGYHEVQFNAANLASGIYFYRLQAGGFQDTRKLVIAK